MKRALARVRAGVAAAVKAIEARDIYALGGTGLIGWGLWQVWQPAGPIAVGAILLYIGLFWRRGNGPAA